MLEPYYLLLTVRDTPQHVFLASPPPQRVLHAVSTTPNAQDQPNSTMAGVGCYIPCEYSPSREVVQCLLTLRSFLYILSSDTYGRNTTLQSAYSDGQQATSPSLNSPTSTPPRPSPLPLQHFRPLHRPLLPPSLSMRRERTAHDEPTPPSSCSSAIPSWITPCPVSYSSKNASTRDSGTLGSSLTRSHSPTNLRSKSLPHIC